MAEPLVTVVVTPREGHFMAERSLLSVLADDAIPFELIYADFAAPPRTAAALRRQADERGFRLVEHAEWMPPAAARKALLPEIRTKYVAFADNDILVERGCLERLVACAEETDAGLVCPLYIEAGGGRTPAIHVAGGLFQWSDAPEPLLLAANNRWQHWPLEQAAGAGRERVDFTEYHYVLGRRDLLCSPGGVSDDVLLVHEHLDLALAARELGWPVVFEPAARITYMAFEPRPLADADFFRRRWDADACLASMTAFAGRWPCVDRDGFVDVMTSYAPSRLQEMSLRRPGSRSEDLATPMRREELAQSRFALREQAIARGYADEDVVRFEGACDGATLLFDGVYRPDGRPFLSHVIGTASVLVRYDMRADIVLAGLLHAALTHRPAWTPEADVVDVLRSASIEVLVGSQPQALAFLGAPDADTGTLNIIGARTVALLAANDVDMRLAGEYRATGRAGDLNDLARERTAAVLAGFGVDGLIASVAERESVVDRRPLLGAAGLQSSFRLDARNRQITPV
jgi:glycosyltransferase involved in cell wall biosynthesis